MLTQALHKLPRVKKDHTEENVSGSISCSSSPSFSRNHPRSPWKAVHTADPVSLYSFAKVTPCHLLLGKSQLKAGGTKRARERHPTLCVKFPQRTGRGHNRRGREHFLPTSLTVQHSGVQTSLDVRAIWHEYNHLSALLFFS